MVGDPSGKEKTREMLTKEDIERNLEGQRPLFAKLIDLDHGEDPQQCRLALRTQLHQFPS